MRKKFFAGNWKMNLAPAEGRALAAGLRAELDRDAGAFARDREVMVAPPFLTIPAVSQALAGSSIMLGAQNMHFEEKGAFTGEVSAPMLRAFGVTHVIVGHSERRHVFGESDELVNKRAAAVVANRMTAIVCVGETLEEREGGRTLEVVLRQLQAGLAGLKPADAARADRRLRAGLGDRHRPHRHARAGPAGAWIDSRGARRSLRARGGGHYPDSLRRQRHARQC